MGKQEAKVITLLGSAGGVARAMLTILNRSARDRKDPIHQLIRRCTLYLIDYKQKDIEYYHTHFPNLKEQMHLLEFDLGDAARFGRALGQADGSAGPAADRVERAGHGWGVGRV